MRRILIERTRRKLAAKHGAGAEHVDADDIEFAAPAKDDELLALDEALAAFAAHDPRKAELVKLRYFAGLSIDEAADVLGISAPSAKRDWTYARASLFRAIQSQRNSDFWGLSVACACGAALTGAGGNSTQLRQTMMASS